MGWKSVAAAAPICGQSHRAEIAIRDLVRPMIVMSSWAGLDLTGALILKSLSDIYIERPKAGLRSEYPMAKGQTCTAAVFHSSPVICPVSSVAVERTGH